ncbi:hypothetical protein CAEBREN_29194 [Caenorhabditis brenneri]|uniref:Uncharacterized protein n=1 Tax=Caenorhabditis brenneri TaxID=135651 RepID=G0PF02_CAEBE|nr:hypothetical protein CAEBREN_29194 [Caenorhabditis brenneri]
MNNLSPFQHFSSFLYLHVNYIVDVLKCINKMKIVIGGERSDHLIPVPLSSAPTDQAIRVVKAFQAGLDRREPSLTGQSAARLREISRQLRLQVDSENREMPVETFIEHFIGTTCERN